jgi:Fe-S cluster assembly protein SufD
MDEDAVFYLKSRGLCDREARKLLQLAFLQEITELISHHGIKEILTQRISDKFDS